jgi:nitric oxide dioxygenase
MLTPNQIHIIKKSWKTYRNMDPVLVGDVFYSKLFMSYPQVKSMFHISKAEQSKKFVEMLNVIVARLDKWHELDEEVRQLGQRHAQYGVKAQHYTAVGEALLWTLEQGYGPEWTPELREAWQACFDELSSTMQQATTLPN